MQATRDQGPFSGIHLMVYLQYSGQATLSPRLQDSEGPQSFDGSVVLHVLSAVLILTSGATVRQEEKRPGRFSGHKAEDSKMEGQTGH